MAAGSTWWQAMLGIVVVAGVLAAALALMHDGSPSGTGDSPP
jgi:hypothetical protein